MTEQIACLIIAPDGSQQHVLLPECLIKPDGVNAPDWLIRRMGLHLGVGSNWRLRPIWHGVEQTSTLLREVRLNVCRARLCLVRTVTACAAFDPREARLRKERLALEKLNTESDYVRVEPLGVLEGSEPEMYRVTFHCRGIVGIDSSQQPVYAERHQVIIQCDDEFPSDAPKLRWDTDIWHPNIQHDEPKGVCINKSEWLGGMGLDDLVRLMFEMVQYKNYHAEMTPPYPLDKMVADWVREYAEPRGIIDRKRGIFVDDKPFTRPTVTERISVVSPPPLTSRIKLLTPPPKPVPSRIKLHSPGPATTGETSRASGPRIKIGRDEG